MDHKPAVIVVMKEKRIYLPKPVHHPGVRAQSSNVVMHEGNAHKSFIKMFTRSPRRNQLAERFHFLFIVK
ncbi:hypothetical protein [Erwinia tracheiphila]|uniref:hypothetical protein n=1 Tax=Erwinia tracheiphila TaxID=65700 RepID=UPI00039DC2DB|nr:hypothetical protein [Erwinia tracheiphila]